MGAGVGRCSEGRRALQIRYLENEESKNWDGDGDEGEWALLVHTCRSVDERITLRTYNSFVKTDLDFPCKTVFLS